MTDIFGTERLRSAVLAAWAASPARFREDANAEEDFALGGYRDRLIVELAQNAADAALRAGVPGRLRLSLREGVLSAANTGAPVDGAGIEGLSTLRVSAKRDDAHAAGRFGVGFAAVVSVCDEPVIGSLGSGVVRWSRDQTAALVAAEPELAKELAERGGHVPLLRLPFPAGPVEIPAGFDTLVRLPLRDEAAEEAVRAMLRETSPALLLGLPALESIEVDVDGETRTVTSEGWKVVSASGRFTPEQVAELFADRPTEERSRPHWLVRWAVPVTGPGSAGSGSGATGAGSASAGFAGGALGGVPDGSRGAAADGSPGVAPVGEPRPLPALVPPVVHAPTPSDEPLDLPALLIASFPMATDRRHVAPGPLADFLVERAADTYLELLAGLPRTPRLLDLVPGMMGKGELDARIRRAILRRLPDAPLLPALSPPADPAAGAGGSGASLLLPDPSEAAGGGAPPAPLPDGGELVVSGRQASVVAAPAELLERVAPMIPGLLPAGWPSRHPAVTALGVSRVQLSDIVDLLSGDAVKDRDPSWWRSLYEVLPADDPEALGALPVPLADGRLVRGPRGTLLLTDGSALDPAVLAPLGLRVVHPDAAHPLLLRLGAGEATPRTVLEDPLTRSAVSESLDSPDSEPVAQAVLALVDAAGLTAGDAPWLSELALRGADGELYPAGELLLADGSLAGLLDSETHFGTAAPELVERYGPRVLAAAGVLDGFAVVNDSDVMIDPDECDHDLDREDEWLETVLDLLPEMAVPPVAREFSAVRDLEYVADWPAALALLSRPPLRSVLHPLRVLVAGEIVEVPSYTAWWLSTHPVLAGRRPTELRLPAGDPLLFGLYGDAPAVVDEAALAMIGVRSTLADLLASHGGPDELLDLLGDPAVEVDRAQLRSLWVALAGVEPARVGPPRAVRAVLGDAIVAVDAEDGRVLSTGADLGDGDEGAGEPVVVEAPDLLPLVAGRPLILAPFDLAEALSELLDLPLAGEEAAGEVTSSGETRDVPPAVRSLLPTAPLTYVEHERLLVDGVPAAWRFFEGTVHASGVEGLARGLAWASGQWGDRLAVAALLRDPAAVPLLLAEADLDSWTAST
ncbi:sacsin N-terminal ATP-binding-like domain-containing protein [Streptosporangium sp. NPDC002721]|uniref:sacsin N-terminal ATP-binding-like domain-containing protein n=1 Tax=Streptosporangium sp. NPDC002721 TaxID=3366188 RepID=UPI0036910E66